MNQQHSTRVTMAAGRKSQRKSSSLDDRFTFIGDGVGPSDQSVFKSSLFEVEDRANGAARILKLWRKTGTSIDEDLRRLWLHEMRQVQRVMSYVGARDVIVDIMEFVEDGAYFGVLLDSVGQPLSAKLRRVTRQHWLKNLGAPRPRTLLWRNMRRLATALGIVHAQGLVHGKLTADVVMTEASNEPDFQLGGFEWSLWLGADKADRSHAKVGPQGRVQRAETYSFAEDWRAAGNLIADCLNVVVQASGDVFPSGSAEVPIVLDVSERVLLKQLVVPSRLDLLDSQSIVRSIDNIIANLAKSAKIRQGSFILGFSANSGLGDAVYTASGGAIAVDEFREQLEWIKADLDGGATLLVPRPFEPAAGSLRLITEEMIYRLRAFRDEGVAVWDIAVCNNIEPRGDALRLGDDDDHVLAQPVVVAPLPREAKEQRARLGPDVLDWSAFAAAGNDPGIFDKTDTIRKALLLVQIVEAIIKALEIYPVEILETGRRDGRRYATIRAEPNSDRDRIARRVGLTESATMLERLFEEDRRDAEGKWRISESASLGASPIGDVVASFIDVEDHKGRHAYQFEIDDELPSRGPFFLRTERDIGTEQVIGRRLRNIKALNTRVDLAEKLEDPWRVRRSSREAIDEKDQEDEAFKDLDEPKQRALMGLWSTLPSYFVVGPPGVGKTKLASETVRRRFSADPSTRMLLSAQGHDALDNLQEKVKATLSENGMDDVIVVRSTTPDRRTTTDEEVHLTGLGYLKELSRSALIENAPESIRDRVRALVHAAGQPNHAKTVERSGLRALSNLVLDAANIVISTANSPDIERLVEAREQFDWVIIEEAAKATGPELVGPLMLSGRRLLIGDHHQLPPFEADRLVEILRDHSLVEEAISLADQLIGPLMREGEIDEMSRVARDPDKLREIAGLGLRLLEPFRTFVEDDERLALGNSTHRPIAATLTEQRRMDPAIACVVSEAFYERKLKTETKRAKAAETEPPPLIHLPPLPTSPVVVVNFEHVSSTGSRQPIERGKPRWHNPSEVDSVIDVLRPCCTDRSFGGEE